MTQTRAFFHRVSYLQYPCMLGALAVLAQPYFTDFATLFTDFNTALMLLGLGTGLASLQDTTKVQNELSRRVWNHPRWSRWTLAVISAMVVFFLAVGALLWFVGSDSRLGELAVGLLVFGIGLLGFLKAAIEMAEHHAAKRD